MLSNARVVGSYGYARQRTLYHCLSGRQGSWGHRLVFRAAGVNGAGITAVWHAEGAEVVVVTVAKSILIFKVFAHAALSAVRKFDPGILHIRPFYIGLFDPQAHGLTWQLIQGIRRKRMTSRQLALRIGVFAVEDFYNAAQTA